MAKLITAVSKLEPAAIGVDFYFSVAVDPVKDEELAAAIRDAKSPDRDRRRRRHFPSDEKAAGLSASLHREGQPTRRAHLSQALEGDFHAWRQGDARVDHGRSANGYASLTSTLASLPEVVSLFGAKEIPDGQQRIDWLFAPEEETRLSHGIPRMKSSRLRTPPSFRRLKNKIVLIGPDFAGLDQLSVPFSLGSQQAVYPGIFVHAQALAQILDGRFFFNWEPWQQSLLLFVIGLIGAAAGWTFHNTKADIVIGIGGSLLIIALSMPFFMAQIPLPTALAILSWAVIHFDRAAHSFMA